MIESVWIFAHIPIFGISLISYLGAINFILVFTSLIMGLAVHKGKVNPITFETMAYFTLFVTLVHGILGLLLLF